MTFFEAVRAVGGASGDGAIDWGAVERAATAAVPAGDLSPSAADRAAYAADVRAARDAIRTHSGLSFTVPETVELQHRHHWIAANVETFARLLAPLEGSEARPVGVGGLLRTLNTGSMALSLAVLADAVLGQYDPLLLADPGEEHGLIFVEPNVRRAATVLDVPYPEFRRWIAFHEVAHAAEFGAAPWLAPYLEDRLEAAVRALEAGRLDPEPLADLDRAMTAVEGYAELLMDEAYDRDAAVLRDRLERHRRRRGPTSRLLRRLLGLGRKRRQYERGRRFFDAVVAERGIEGAGRVWDGSWALPSEGELEEPAAWLDRVA